MGENMCKTENCGSSGCPDGNCGKSCSKGECCDTGCNMCNKMVKLADKAWEHAVMEKMKAHWEKTMGEQMDKIAEASVKTSAAYHMNMMKGKTEVHEAAKGIQEAMSAE